MKKSVAICDTQPVTVAGLRAMLDASADLQYLAAVNSVAAAVDMGLLSRPALLIIDKAFGSQAVLDALARLKASGWPGAAVVWGVSVTESEALRFVRAGAKGIVRKSADPETLLVCLRSVAAGATWMERSVFHREHRRERRKTSPNLTPREQQVMELVGQGLKNREVAKELGIRPGTVKVHLKHIFEKTGAPDRYNLALAGLAAAAGEPGQTAMAS